MGEKSPVNPLGYFTEQPMHYRAKTCLRKEDELGRGPIPAALVACGSAAPP